MTQGIRVLWPVSFPYAASFDIQIDHAFDWSLGGGRADGMQRTTRVRARACCGYSGCCGNPLYDDMATAQRQLRNSIRMLSHNGARGNVRTGLSAQWNIVSKAAAVRGRTVFLAPITRVGTQTDHSIGPNLIFEFALSGFALMDRASVVTLVESRVAALRSARL